MLLALYPLIWTSAPATLPAFVGPQLLKAKQVAPAAGDFGQVAPGEIESFSIDFTAKLSAGDTLSSVASIVSTYLGGVDPGASALLQGSPVISGNVVSQFIGASNGFQAGVTYRWTAIAQTALGASLIAWGHIACIPIN
jgi:hypothetical protein